MQKAISPLNENELAAGAAQNLAQWLTWRDSARIQIAKTIRPEAAAQIPQQQEHSASACQQDDIAAAADTPTQSAKLSFLFTQPQRASQSNLPPNKRTRRD